VQFDFLEKNISPSARAVATGWSGVDISTLGWANPPWDGHIHLVLGTSIPPWGGHHPSWGGNIHPGVDISTTGWTYLPNFCQRMFLGLMQIQLWGGAAS